VNLASVDMNLLKALHALLETRSVSRAAIRLNVTQSAVSHSLRRLRAQFDDPLLVRDGSEMAPTTTALRLQGPVGDLIAGAQSLFTIGNRFEPTRDARAFRLAMSDAMTIEALPAIVAAIRSEAPRVDLKVERGGPNYSCSLLAEDQADAALGVIPKLPRDLRSAELYRDELVCIADRANPFLKKGRLTFEAFLKCPHVTMAQNSDSGIELDEILNVMGVQRRIALTVPHYLAIPATIAGTDLVAHSRRKLLRMLRLTSDLVAMPIPVPFPVPELVFTLAWHPRHDLDSAHLWLRQIICRALR
jgi:DNA-binding transcriptional LysR family regulator